MTRINGGKRILTTYMLTIASRPIRKCLNTSMKSFPDNILSVEQRSTWWLMSLMISARCQECWMNLWNMIKFRTSLVLAYSHQKMNLQLTNTVVRPCLNSWRCLWELPTWEAMHHSQTLAITDMSWITLWMRNKDRLNLCMKSSKIWLPF